MTATPTFRAIKELCASHITDTEGFGHRVNPQTSTPCCSFQQIVRSPPSATASHDHPTIQLCPYCRSARSLYDLASTVYHKMDVMEAAYGAEVAALHKEVAMLRRCVFEWQEHFSRDQTPGVVFREVESLRIQVADLQKEKEEMARMLAAQRCHVDCIYHVVRERDANAQPSSAKKKVTAPPSRPICDR